MRSEKDIDFVQGYQNLKTRYQSLQNMTGGLKKCTNDLRELLNKIPDKENHQQGTSHSGDEKTLKLVVHG